MRLFPKILIDGKEPVGARNYDFLWMTDKSKEVLLHDHISREFVRIINDWRKQLGKQYSEFVAVRINATELIEKVLYTRTQYIIDECKINIRMTNDTLKNVKTIDLPHPLIYFSELLIDLNSTSCFLSNKYGVTNSTTFHTESMQYEEELC